MAAVDVRATEDPKVIPAAGGPDPTDLLPKKLAHARPLFDPDILRRAVKGSFVKLKPVWLVKSPVIFGVEVVEAITAMRMARDIATGAPGIGFPIQIALWLWFTVLFANF